MVAITNDPPRSSVDPESRFFMGGAIAMTLVVVAGFSIQLLMGRSTFAAPPMIHAHAIVFMGWVVIFLSQNLLVASGNLALHRRLGWVAAAWVALMVVVGCAVTAFDIREGRVPFFFKPLQFLVFDPMSLFAFAGLIFTGVGLRKRTDWHRRLNFSAMAILIGAAFGRLLPMPLLAPWAWEATVVACLTLLLVIVALDARRVGRVHPAWLWGVATMIAVVPVTEAITYSPVGLALYQSVTTGAKGASVAPLQFGTPPSPPAAGK